MQTLAHISRRRSSLILLLTLVYLAVLVAVGAYTLTQAMDIMADPGWIATALLVAALAAGGFIEQVFLLLATLGPSGRVLWARGGYLVHLSPFRARMKISAISSVEIVTARRGFGKRSYILIRSKWKKIYVLLYVCAESGDEIVNSIRGVLR